VTVRDARADDFERVESLLRAHSLPVAGVPASLEGFLVAESDGQVVGSVGVETCGHYGLLRSAAVDAQWQGRGVGRELVEQAVRQADSRGLRALFLLTTTAERFFPMFGFNVVQRAEVPAAVKATEEFTSACPESATVMARMGRKP
jgi:amino-acid N-acetyltransferase